MPLRLALVEGQFPVLPWLGVFFAGMVVGRWLLAEEHGRVLALARACLLIGLALIGLDYAAGHVSEVDPGLEELLGGDDRCHDGDLPFPIGSAKPAPDGPRGRPLGGSR